MACDSKNTTNAVVGKAQIKARSVARWLAGVNEASAYIGRELEVRHIARALNGGADRMAGLASRIFNLMPEGLKEPINCGVEWTSTSAKGIVWVGSNSGFQGMSGGDVEICEWRRIVADFYAAPHLMRHPTRQLDVLGTCVPLEWTAYRPTVTHAALFLAYVA